MRLKLFGDENSVNVILEKSYDCINYTYNFT